MSTLIVKKAEFQQLAEQRLTEAKVLLDSQLWDGAYYLAGYAVELALKACIIRKLLTTDAFPDKDFSEKCYTHDISVLLKKAGLEAEHNHKTSSSPDFEKNRGVTKDWTEKKRYHRIEKMEAEAIYLAISDPDHGVLSWIKSKW